jgi:uncharacterized protein
MRIPFLTALWEDLVFLNFEVDPEILKKYTPRGTELDLFENKAFVSLVAFYFKKNRLFGIFPGFPHYSFEEVNLRFYIRRGDKRAVAFIKEVVPSKLIATIARVLYEEPYIALKMTSSKAIKESSVELTYTWGNCFENRLTVKSEKPCHPLEPNSFEEFILEHYWGYTPQKNGSTIEYQVHHPKWRVGYALDFEMSESIKNFYGHDFSQTLSKKPSSVFIAEGSKIAVSFPKRFFHP